MKKVFEEMYNTQDINPMEKIVQNLAFWDRTKYSVEFFVSKEVLTIKVYRRDL